VQKQLVAKHKDAGLLILAHEKRGPPFSDPEFNKERKAPPGESCDGRHRYIE
jgi:hypothetical protein